MKFVNFKDANRQAQGLHYHEDPAGYMVLALQLDKKDIKALRNGDTLYVIAGPGLKVPPPLMITLDSPFVPIPEMKINKDNETTDSKSTSDDK